MLPVVDQFESEPNAAKAASGLSAGVEALCDAYRRPCQARPSP